MSDFFRAGRSRWGGDCCKLIIGLKGHLCAEPQCFHRREDRNVLCRSKICFTNDPHSILFLFRKLKVCALTGLRLAFRVLTASCGIGRPNEQRPNSPEPPVTASIRLFRRRLPVLAEFRDRRILFPGPLRSIITTGDRRVLD
jgi:hypothetical protein